MVVGSIDCSLWLVIALVLKYRIGKYAIFWHVLNTLTLDGKAIVHSVKLHCLLLVHQDEKYKIIHNALYSFDN